MPKPRKRPDLKPLKTFRIFCEGEKSEPNYLNGYIATLRSENRQSVVQIEPTRKNTAIQLVQEASNFKKSARSLPEDVFWVVYDRESTSKYSDESHAKALNQADTAGIKVALCNVCFEYWILLHLINTDAPYQNYDDLHKNSALEGEFQRLTGRPYSKSSIDVFYVLKDSIPTARRRGRKINEDGKARAAIGRDKDYHINPYVGIVDLLDAIDDFDKKPNDNPPAPPDGSATPTSVSSGEADKC